MAAFDFDCEKLLVEHECLVTAIQRTRHGYKSFQPEVPTSLGFPCIFLVYWEGNFRKKVLGSTHGNTRMSFSSVSLWGKLCSNRTPVLMSAG